MHSAKMFTGQQYIYTFHNTLAFLRLIVKGSQCILEVTQFPDKCSNPFRLRPIILNIFILYIVFIQKIMKQEYKVWKQGKKKNQKRIGQTPEKPTNILQIHQFNNVTDPFALFMNSFPQQGSILRSRVVE